jgi:ABC-2 type transport system ATP-binding protein
MAGDTVIQLIELEKHFGKVRALQGLTLEVQPGPIGLLGPNGAGKTTLLKLLLGLLRPDHGSARIAGYDPGRRADRLALRRTVGYMPESDCLIPGMTAVELVATLGRITGLERDDAMKRAHEVLDYVGLEDQRYRGLEEYSTGMKQRLKLAQALVHDPALLLLDEPTNGLDPKGRKHMLELVYDLGHKQQKNILLCSHLLPDVERTCRDIIVIHRGRVVESGCIADMTQGDDRRINLRIEGDDTTFAGVLSGAGYEHNLQGPGRFEVRVANGRVDADAFFVLASRCGVSLTGVDRLGSSLEEVFLRTLEVNRGEEH